MTFASKAFFLTAGAMLFTVVSLGWPQGAAERGLANPPTEAAQSACRLTYDQIAADIYTCSDAQSAAAVEDVEG